MAVVRCPEGQDARQVLSLRIQGGLEKLKSVTVTGVAQILF